MNCDNGELYKYNNKEDLEKEMKKAQELMRIDMEDATELQKVNMQVSLHDNRSKLGKKRVAEKKKKRNRSKRKLLKR